MIQIAFRIVFRFSRLRGAVALCLSCFFTEGCIDYRTLFVIRVGSVISVQNRWGEVFFKENRFFDLLQY